jgi:hypothetical protein
VEAEGEKVGLSDKVGIALTASRTQRRQEPSCYRQWPRHKSGYKSSGATAWVSYTLAYDTRRSKKASYSLLIGDLDDRVDLTVIMAEHQLEADDRHDNGSLLNDHSSALEPRLEHIGIHLNSFTGLTPSFIISTWISTLIDQ